MYSAGYGFPNAGGGGTPAYNGAPPPQNPHMQPGAPNQPQQMMYNPQQFPMTSQGPFSGGPNPNLMSGAGPAAMMQNAGMPHMAANGQIPSYQTPYSNSPYGPSVPSPAGPQSQLPPNYMTAGPMGSSYPVPGGGMPSQQQQHMMQRMQPPQGSPSGSGMPTPQRGHTPQQGTPSNPTPSQPPQFSPPQNLQPAPQSQTPNSNNNGSSSHNHNHNHNNTQQGPALHTPQTPTFPSNAQGPAVNGTSEVSTPLSPNSESKEKERFSVLLEINQELLFDALQLQHTQTEMRKENAGGKADGANGPEQDKKPSEQENIVQQDYVQCMRRLQGNLAYLATLADRKGAQQQPCPAILSPPPLNLGIDIKYQPGSRDAADKSDAKADRQERDRVMKDLYRKLQALFPGFDPRKEPAFATVNPRAAGQGLPGMPGPNTQRPNQASPSTGQKTPQMSAAPAPLQSL